MREVIQTFTSTEEGGFGVTSPIPMDQYISPFNVGFGVHPSGTATYTVQHTFEDPFASNFDPSTAVWFNHPDVASESGNNDGNYAFPVRAIRLNVALSDNTPITFWVAQAGI